MSHEGQLFVVSAPSGTGKTTMLGRVMEGISGIEFSISHTTREKRKGEQDGVDYHFVSEQVFQKKIEEGHFLEWAKVHGNYYGTSMDAIRSRLKKGVDVILDIDVQGARLVRASDYTDSVQIFIAPPSMEELGRRLLARGTESEEALSTRLKNAEEELKAVDEYPFLIINDNLANSVDMLRAVILSTRAARHRDISGNPVDFSLLS